MKFIKTAFIILTTLIINSSYAGIPPSNNANANSSLSPMLKETLPSVVNIAVRGELPLINLPYLDRNKAQNNLDNLTPKFEDLGSGVIVDAENGYILTNAHVIKDAEIITVTLNDGRRMQGKVIGFDAQSDIAVIKIKAKHLNAITFGDSDKINVGDFVCAIGSPFGLHQTVTSGVVSGMGRNIEGFENFIQTDAPINPGNSGGALVNMRGDLIGINTAIITPNNSAGNVGIGLSIPSNMAKSVMEQLIKYGKVTRGMLGVLVQNVTPALADAIHLSNTEGALVSQVIAGTPAANAGIHNKDVIVKIMNKPVHTATQVSNTVSLLPIGTKVTMQIWRDGKNIELSAETIDSEKFKKTAENTPKQLFSGMQLKDFNQLVNNELITGVEILYVDPTSIGYSCGIRRGDVILAVANKRVTNLNELQDAFSKNPSQLLLEIKRGFSGNIFLVLEE
jgi:serine protease Do